MQDKPTRQLVTKLRDEIPNLVDNSDSMTRSDIQSSALAVAVKVVNKYYAAEDVA
ncbi:hypothetical protein [Nocardia puris]|uniref:Uncharacterized protein n=1 Tax=Nocardia puris TaxID=208602 RepID=A0A366DBN3_9NOCA|nr:hypothetical protein [Nocardia puris]RBO86834.1 hypothetical protein DFR74_1125 [Nocardia puris]